MRHRRSATASRARRKRSYCSRMIHWRRPRHSLRKLHTSMFLPFFFFCQILNYHFDSCRKLLIILGWAALILLAYKVSQYDTEMANFDPFEILGISAVSYFPMFHQPDYKTTWKKCFRVLSKSTINFSFFFSFCTGFVPGWDQESVQKAFSHPPSWQRDWKRESLHEIDQRYSRWISIVLLEKSPVTCIYKHCYPLLFSLQGPDRRRGTKELGKVRQSGRSWSYEFRHSFALVDSREGKFRVGVGLVRPRVHGRFANRRWHVVVQKYSLYRRSGKYHISRYFFVNWYSSPHLSYSPSGLTGNYANVLRCLQ